MSGNAFTDRAAWLAHFHVCAECERHQPCERGRALMAAMRATMAPEESLPAWM